ncbi:metallophosphoesterase [Polynucleobacter sp. UK-Kesae-W10]|uniref:metallophosphoesterase n=1 Tax=Polynucleobacter sp. UK-Kesae-W10 TaxID=1819738 RepID=UPI001C0C4265|nr:metallophosphoesterase [Polynucleobacter sp. UK-Kesae-W10]MBU3577564.1 metallophosphoesterase [Polynucleobacter sp. UK-Kesae-W10]
MIKTFTKNATGKDWVVGDVHGHFKRLEDALDKIGFDPAKDRLFSTGDLVDRGPASEEAIDWLAKPWFHAVMGNHEQMAIDHVSGNSDPRLYLQNGGAWFLSLPDAAQQDIACQFAVLPIAIEVETDNGLVGIVHAEAPLNSWEMMRYALTEADEYARNQWIVNCLWSRTKINGADDRPVAGISAVICGHTPLSEVVEVGNTIFIDTYGWGPNHKAGALTFVDLSDLSTVSIHRDISVISA